MKPTADEVVDNIIQEQHETFEYEITICQRVRKPKERRDQQYGNQVDVPATRRVLNTVLSEEEFKKIRNAALSQF